MHFSTFLSTTALVLTANAFLIPQEIADDVQAAKAKASEFVPQIVDHNSQSLKLDCASCPFALKTERNGVHEWTNDVESDLIMHFAAKDDHLTLNGKPFYPVTMQDLPGLLFAPQVKKASSSETGFERYEKDLKLSYTLEFQDEKTEDGNTVVGILMTILGLDGQMIKIENLKIEAIKHADGSVSLPFLANLKTSTNHLHHQLSLAKLSTVAPSPSDPDAKCTNMVCRVMTKLSAAVSTARAKAAAAAHSTKHAAKKMKGFCMRCFHRLAGHPHPHHPPPTLAEYDNGGEDGSVINLPTHNHVVPGHFRQPHHAGHRHHHGGFLRKTMHLARHLFTFVLLPVIVGVAVGMTASAIGMLVGQAVVFLWMRYRRSGRQGAYEAVQSEDKEDGLPSYVDEGLPAYTEETAVAASDEKEENKA
jgi:hypothetical protein